jgi:hypothetical protein
MSIIHTPEFNTTFHHGKAYSQHSGPALMLSMAGWEHGIAGARSCLCLPKISL